MGAMESTGGRTPGGNRIVRVGMMLSMARSLVSTMEGMLEQLQGELALLEQDRSEQHSQGSAPTAGAELEALREENGQLRDAMAGRGIIEQAKGIVMVESGCGAEDAFRLLVDRSRKERRKVRDIAQEIVSAASNQNRGAAAVQPGAATGHGGAPGQGAVLSQVWPPPTGA